MSAGVCGPILHEAIGLLYGETPPEGFAMPRLVQEETVCSMSGRRASGQCPHTAIELASAKHILQVCDLPHEGEHHDLGAGYARWLERREVLQGTSRFRLMKPDPSVPRPKSELIGRRGVQGSPAPSRNQAIEIISPHNRDRFILSRHRSNHILFRALPERVVEHVTWYLDGTELAVTGPPYELLWEPTRGSHELLAVTPDNAAAKASFIVE